MSDVTLNPFDIMVLIALGLSGLLSLSRGFTTEVLSLASWAGAALVTMHGLPYVEPYARKYIEPDFIADLIAIAGLGLLSLMTLRYGAGLIGSSIKNSNIGALDRALGVLFGLLRGALIVCLGYLLMIWVIGRDDMPDWVMEAKSRPLAEYGTSILLAAMPESIAERAGDTRDNYQLLEKLQRNLPDEKGDNDGSGYSDDVRQQLDEFLKKSGS
ncbi:MAG: hypothetical protein CMF31_09980 [Kordiimonas sp.]|nr:hypothetical protein [Kordiimonas sp.]|tara:strand:+ start:922 stop:1563 length:642 start_codon:yes stop_codon:yes gene_type:complete